MSEGKFIKKMLTYQESVDSGASEVRENFLETQKMLFEVASNTAQSQEEKDKIQEAYDEYVRIEEEVFEEKRGSATSDDIKERIPDNYWIELTSSALDSKKKKNQKLILMLYGKGLKKT